MVNVKEKFKNVYYEFFILVLELIRYVKWICKLLIFMIWIVCDRVYKKIEYEIWILFLLFVNKNILVYFMIKYF